MLQRIALMLVAAGVLALTPGTAQADGTADIAAKLAVAANCKDKASVLRPWCPAADWAKGKAGTLKPGLMVGITVAISADADVGKALMERVSLVFFAVRKDGKQLVVTLRDIAPENDDEAAMVASAVGTVSSVLKGKEAKVTLHKDLRAFGDSLIGEANRVATRGKTGWTWTTDDNTAELRQVGGVWVLIEAPKDGKAGRFVTVLTPKVK